ncbi:MAG: hypothetical protein HKP31_06410 [Nitrosopumilus sp.]|nr:hypothetical protein [Nitrosopumilus sp.]
MSTILIHKQSETNQIQNMKIKRTKVPAVENVKEFCWEDVAGLSWILLDEEDY